MLQVTELLAHGSDFGGNVRQPFHPSEAGDEFAAGAD